MTEGLKFLMIVDDPGIARFVSSHGVDTLFVDLEWMGKQVRQPKAESWKSKQTPEDITRIRDAAPEAELLVRLNPLYEGTAAEISDAVARGANCLMQPMFSTATEARQFRDLVAGRARVVPLFETASALRALPEMIRNDAIDRAHIGLNDLHLDLGMRFMFEPLADGTLEETCALFRAHDVPFGIGGLARVGEGILDPALLLGEHVRLGSSWTILSRSFHRQARTVDELQATTDFAAEVNLLRAKFEEFRQAGPEALEQNRVRVADRVRDVAHLLASG